MQKAKRVFVVHGRNKAARDAMFSFLRALSLEPLEWEQAVKCTGKTAPTTLEIVTAGLADAQAIVILLTGDDHAQLRPELGHEPPLYQPRPNVFFESGLALSLAGDSRVIFVKTRNLREFSDIDGINYIHLDDSPIHRNAFVERLRSAGCRPDTSGSDYLRPQTAGEFNEVLDYDHEGPEILYRGGYTNDIIDSAISYTISSVGLYKDAAKYLSGGGTVDLKYNYIGALGATNWLAISQDPSYIHGQLLAIYKDNIFDIVKSANIIDEQIDYISLGPGDGEIDIAVLLKLQQHTRLMNYYPLDISLELLQEAITKVVNCSYLPKTFRVKAVHGDFARLGQYRSIYGFDRSINFFGLMGFSLGNYNEAELLGKIREGMNSNDLLLLDARLHDFGDVSTSLDTEQTKKVIGHYANRMHNRFAFGPVEMMTDADFDRADIQHEVNTHFTSVPAALNVVVYCRDIIAKLKSERKRIKRSRLNLGVTTVYDADRLEQWLIGRGFHVRWKKQHRGTLVILLQKL